MFQKRDVGVRRCSCTAQGRPVLDEAFVLIEGHLSAPRSPPTGGFTESNWSEQENILAPDHKEQLRCGLCATALRTRKHVQDLRITAGFKSSRALFP